MRTEYDISVRRTLHHLSSDLFIKIWNLEIFHIYKQCLCCWTIFLSGKRHTFLTKISKLLKEMTACKNGRREKRFIFFKNLKCQRLFKPFLRFLFYRFTSVRSIEGIAFWIHISSSNNYGGSSWTISEASHYIKTSFWPTSWLEDFLVCVHTWEPLLNYTTIKLL